jgi:hypothetical protein
MMRCDEANKQGSCWPVRIAAAEPVEVAALIDEFVSRLPNRAARGRDAVGFASARDVSQL